MVELGRPEASAKFVPLRAETLRADAHLEQIGHQVEIHVNISDAEAGRRRLLLREDGSCTGHAALERPRERVLGELKVSDERKGELVVHVDDANLKPQASHSLLGQALVLSDRSAASSEPVALACAQIRAD
jgi:hypothetical protein